MSARDDPSACRPTSRHSWRCRKSVVLGGATRSHAGLGVTRRERGALRGSRGQRLHGRGRACGSGEAGLPRARGRHADRNGEVDCRRTPGSTRGDAHTASPREASIVLIRNGKELASVNDGPQLATTQPPAATPEALPGRSPPPGSAGHSARAMDCQQSDLSVRLALGALAPHARSVTARGAQFDGTLGPWTTERVGDIRGQRRPERRADHRQRALHFTWRLAAMASRPDIRSPVGPVKGRRPRAFDTDHPDDFHRPFQRASRFKFGFRTAPACDGGGRFTRPTASNRHMRLSDMKAVEAPPGTGAGHLPGSDSLLVVVDTVNASPGSVGEPEISDVKPQEPAGHRYELSTAGTPRRRRTAGSAPTPPASAAACRHSPPR